MNVDEISWDIHIWWACQEREIPIVVDSNNSIGETAEYP
jgi:hypothetical protein